MRKSFTLLSLFLCSLLFSQVTLDYYLDANHPYDDNIPTPKDLLGYEVGSWHVSHDKLVNYMYRLAEVSNRISIEKRGETHEGRPLLLLTITSPENHSNLDAIQKTHVRLTKPDGQSIDVSKQPLIVYQGFSVHGNEPSGANAGLLAVYHLAASKSDETVELLKNIVILIDPSFNPDGLQRFAYWANTNKNKNLTSDPNDREYREVWPGGRTNHYWFDLNRDWLAGQLPESQARLKSYSKWLPNILTDHHEMGTNSSFFFQPGIPSRVNPLTPDLNQELTKKISEFHIEAFNNLGSLYYSEEDYDDFYFGKGSAYPDINGGIGILFEQASSRGHIQESDNGLLTFPFTIRNQLTAIFSTLKASISLRVELLNYFRNFHKISMDEAKKDKQKAILFGNLKDPTTTYHLAKILDRHQIQFHELKNEVVKNGNKYSPEASYIIPLEQTKSKLIRAMFSTQSKFKDSLFYDVSAWTFPYALNLNHSYENNTNNIGRLVTELKESEGKITKKSSYAYLFEAHNYNVPKLLNKLQKHNIRIKIGLTPFTLENKTYDYGTYMIPAKNQSISENDLYEILKKASKETHIIIDGVNSGHTKGIDLGSRKFTTVKKPEIALLVGDGVKSYDAGEIWHLMDIRHEITISKIDIRNLNQNDLSRYTHFIIPDFSGSGLNDYTEKIKEFVNKGGTLIGYQNTIKWLNENEFIKLDFVSKSLVAREISFEKKELFEGAQQTRGAIFNTIIDRSHPINFGYQNTTLPIFRNSNIYMKADEQSYNNPIQYTSAPLLSGYISEENLALLKNTVPFKVSRLGEGRVIVLTDNTNFRAFWFGTNRILTNALYLSDKM